MYGSSREIVVSLSDGQSSIQNVESLDRVGNVHNGCLWANVQNDALDCADKMVVQSEISGQRDDGLTWQSVLFQNAESLGKIESNNLMRTGQGTEVMHFNPHKLFITQGFYGVHSRSFKGWEESGDNADHGKNDERDNHHRRRSSQENITFMIGGFVKLAIERHGR